MTAAPLLHHTVRPAAAPDEGATDNVAAIYNQAGDNYIAYADGDAARLFAFDGMHAYADRRVWAVLEAKLTELRASGADSLSLLDAGCGPGTWLRRLVVRAVELGFVRIKARGFDVAQVQVHRARLLARDLSALPGVNLTFEVADLARRMPEADGSVDITLCLYSVLSHLPVASLSAVSAELARVTSGYFVTTVRSVGSTATAFVDSMMKVRRLKQDHRRNRCEIELSDGRHTSFSLHLFTANELRSYFAGHFAVEEMRGLDLFHSRFMLDPRWNPACVGAHDRLLQELGRLEEAYATSPEFIDRATHLLLVARRRQAGRPTIAAIAPAA